MSVGPFSETACRKRLQSNSAILRLRFVVDVRSFSLSSFSGIPDLRATSLNEISFVIGPESPPVGLSTLIGYVRHTSSVLRTRLGAIPASARQPLTVVSREVTNG